MRPRLLELPDAPLLASAAALLVLLYTCWRAFTLAGKGWRAAAPSIVIGLLVAGFLLKVVAFGEGFEKAKVPIFSYGFMIMLGFAGVILIAALRGRWFGMDHNHILDLGLFAMLGGIVGARLWHFWQYHDQYDGWLQFFQIWKGGIVFYGGLVGGFLCCAFYMWKHKLDFWTVAEVCGPPIPIGIAFARLGCFLNGCCFGGTCGATSFGAVRFPAHPGGDVTTQSPAFAHHLTAARDALAGAGAPGSAAYEDASATLTALQGSGWSYWVHPAQLFESIGTMAMFVLLMLHSRFLARRPGESFFLLLVLYAPFRFWMETMRDDTPANWFGLTAGQFAGFPLVAIGLAGLLWVRYGHPPGMQGKTMVDGVAVGALLKEQQGPRPDAPTGLRPLREEAEVKAANQTPAE